MATTAVGNPYVESSDLVANYPATSLALANRIDVVGVNPFADAAARTTAIPSPVEGQMSSLADTDSVERYDGSAWVAVAGGKILQVVTVLKQDSFTTTSTSYTDVTGLTVSITPTSATSTILVMVSLGLGNLTQTGLSRGQILRGATVVGAGTPVGLRVAGSFAYQPQTTTAAVPTQNMTFVDSPATTSATTYKIQIASDAGTSTVGYGYNSDANVAQVIRNASAITLMEVSA
jgi:hypothetical protein